MRLRFFATAVVAGLAVLGSAAPAALAHDQLLNSSPLNGAVLESPPSEVSLSFNEAVLDLGNAIIVNDNSGTDWVDGDVVLTTDGVSAPLKSGMPDGVYTMEWRVVSADGHPVSGTIVFGVGTSDTIKDEVTTATAAISPPADDDDDATPVAASSDSGLNTWQIVGIGAVGALVAIGLFVGAISVIRKNQRGHDGDAS